MLRRYTAALVIVSALLVVSLAAVGKLYADKRAAQAAETQPSQFSQEAWAGPGASEAVQDGEQPPDGGGQGQGYAPGGGRTLPASPGASGAPFARGGTSRFGGGAGPRAGAPRAQPGAPPPGPGDTTGAPGPPETGSPPPPMSGPSGSRQAGSGSRPSRASAPLMAGAAAASESGSGPRAAPDPRLTESLRNVPRVREALENAKVAIRENNQDQLVEILDEALALLPSTTPGGAPPPSGPGGRRPFGAGYGSGAGGLPRSGPPAGGGDLLAEGQRMQDLLF